MITSVKEIHYQNAKDIVSNWAMQCGYDFAESELSDLVDEVAMALELSWFAGNASDRQLPKDA